MRPLFESLIAHYLIWQRNALSRIFWQYRPFSVSFQGGLRASTALCVRLLRPILCCFFKVSISDLGDLPIMLLSYLYGVSEERDCNVCGACRGKFGRPISGYPLLLHSSAPCFRPVCWKGQKH